MGKTVFLYWDGPLRYVTNGARSSAVNMLMTNWMCLPGTFLGYHWFQLTYNHLIVSVNMCLFDTYSIQSMLLISIFFFAAWGEDEDCSGVHEGGGEQETCSGGNHGHLEWEICHTQGTGWVKSQGWYLLSSQLRYIFIILSTTRFHKIFYDVIWFSKVINFQ